MDRAEYRSLAHALAKRGQELPHTKLLDVQVGAIRSAVRQREALRRHIADNLSNEALARSYGVHVRTIEKIVQRFSWAHIP